MNRKETFRQPQRNHVLLRRVDIDEVWDTANGIIKYLYELIDRKCEAWGLWEEMILGLGDWSDILFTANVDEDILAGFRTRREDVESEVAEYMVKWKLDFGEVIPKCAQDLVDQWIERSKARFIAMMDESVDYWGLGLAARRKYLTDIASTPIEPIAPTVIELTQVEAKTTRIVSQVSIEDDFTSMETTVPASNSVSLDESIPENGATRPIQVQWPVFEMNRHRIGIRPKKRSERVVHLANKIRGGSRTGLFLRRRFRRTICGKRRPDSKRCVYLPDRNQRNMKRDRIKGRNNAKGFSCPMDRDRFARFGRIKPTAIVARRGKRFHDLSIDLWPQYLDRVEDDRPHQSRLQELGQQMQRLRNGELGVKRQYLVQFPNSYHHTRISNDPIDTGMEATAEIDRGVKLKE